MPIVEETDLICNATVAQMAGTWNEYMTKVEAAIKTIEECDQALTVLFGRSTDGTYNFDTSFKHCSTYGKTNPKDVIDKKRRRIWGMLLSRLGVRKLMTNRRAEEMDKQLERGEVPEITEENILGLLNKQATSVSDYIKESIGECYNWLRPCGFMKEYKTNSKYEVGEKVIIGWGCENWSYNGHPFRVTHSRENNFRMLESIFRALDGKGLPKTHSGELVDAINQSPNGRGETTYFEFKCFKNNNVHLKFKRPDLVTEFNRVAGGGQLKPENEK